MGFGFVRRTYTNIVSCWLGEGEELENVCFKVLTFTSCTMVLFMFDKCLEAFHHVRSQNGKFII